MRGGAPETSEIVEQAIRVWNFCEGWNPERLPVALACVEVADADLLVEVLVEIKGYMAERKAFQERVAAEKR